MLRWRVVGHLDVRGTMPYAEMMRSIELDGTEVPRVRAELARREATVGSG